MYVKFPPENLNPDPCPPQPTSTYTCGVTTTPRMRGDINEILIKDRFTWNNIKIVYFKFLKKKKKSL